MDVRYVTENFNGDASDGLVRPVKQWQARQESKDLSKVTIRGLLSKLEDGGGKRLVQFATCRRRDQRLGGDRVGLPWPHAAQIAARSPGRK